MEPRYYTDGEGAAKPYTVGDAMPQTESTDNLDFGQALRALKRGKKVQRDGWNGMWLILVPGAIQHTAHARDAVLRGPRADHVTINAHIDMCVATGDMQSGWNASQQDLLSDDWRIYE